MKTYEQGKAELDAELDRLKQAMKDAKKNITYDFSCPSCKKVKKIRVHCSNTGIVGKQYCCSNCRTKAYRKRKEAREKAERQGLRLSEVDYKIYKLQQQIKELKNEKR